MSGAEPQTAPFDKIKRVMYAENGQSAGLDGDKDAQDESCATP